MAKPLGLRLALYIVKAFTGEVRQLRKAVEQLVDTSRQVNRLPLLYSGDAADRAGTGPLEATPRASAWQPRPGEFLTWWVLEELGREFKLPIEADLPAEAVSRGWVDPSTGKFLVMPTAAGEELDGATIRELVGAPQ